MNIFLGITAENALQHSRSFLFLSVIWLILAFLSSKKKHPIVTVLHFTVSGVLVTFSRYSFSVAWKAMRIFAPIKAISSILSMLLIMIVILICGWNFWGTVGHRTEEEDFHHELTDDSIYSIEQGKKEGEYEK